MGTGKSWLEIESLWACKAFVRASENPIVGNGQTATDFSMRIKRRWSEIVSDAQETSKTSDVVPSSAPTRTGDAILQHFRKVRKDCIKFFALTQQVKEMKPTGEPRRLDLERVATALWNAKGDDKKSSAVKQSMYEYIGDEPNVKDPGPRFKFMHAYKYLETCAQHNLTLGAVESANPQKSVSTAAVFTTSDNSIIDDTDCVPADEEFRGAPPVSARRSASSGAMVDDGDAGDAASAAIATVQRANKNLQRPLGKKRALTMQKESRLADAIARGAAGIEKLAEASHKRTKLYNESLKVDRDRADTEKFKANLALFNMNGTDPTLRELYLKNMQERVLADLAGAAGTAESRADRITAGADSTRPLALNGGVIEIASED
jgi:hypothetical protein